MKQTSKNRPARKAGAKKAAKATAPRKPAKARKPAAKKRSAPKKAAARKSRSAKPCYIAGASAAGLSGTSADESPALAALEAALSGQDGNGAAGDRLTLDSGTGDPSLQAEGQGDAGEDTGDTPARVNKLVPTNAVHTTKRRMKRNTWQGPVLAFGAVAAMLALVVLGHDRSPPDVSPLEQHASADISDSPLLGSESPSVSDSVQPTPQVPSWRDQQALSEDPMGGLKVLELVELERLLQKLDMGPSRPDGIVDRQTVEAIRMYQQIAGLPADGEPSRELLEDMREVAKMLDGEG